MKCQNPNCKKDVKWRIVDRYCQQTMTFTYFYYVCDEHKTSKKLPGHTKTITAYTEN